MAGLYRNPRLYDLALSSRQVQAEVDALTEWHVRLRGRPPTRALELAAGPAAHARELAHRGMDATALDRSRAMCAYAERAARRAGVALEVVCADMADFALPGRFDLAFSMSDSASHLHSLDEMVSHLRCVAAHLAAGGLYVLEMAHPADFLTRAPRTRSRWRLTRDGARLEVRWREPAKGFDPVSQLAENRVTVVVEERGRRTVLTDRLVLRRWTALELAAAVRLAACFELSEQHGSFDPDSSFDSSAGEYRMISVLRRARRRSPSRRPRSGLT